MIVLVVAARCDTSRAPTGMNPQTNSQCLQTKMLGRRQPSTVNSCGHPASQRGREAVRGPGRQPSSQVARRPRGWAQAQVPASQQPNRQSDSKLNRQQGSMWRAAARQDCRQAGRQAWRRKGGQVNRCAGAQARRRAGAQARRRAQRRRAGGQGCRRVVSIHLAGCVRTRGLQRLTKAHPFNDLAAIEIRLALAILQSAASVKDAILQSPQSGAPPLATKQIPSALREHVGPCGSKAAWTPEALGSCRARLRTLACKSASRLRLGLAQRHAHASQRIEASDLPRAGCFVDG